MALKTLMLRKKLESAQSALEALRAKDEEFNTREAELEQAIEEAETEEERATVEEEVEKFGTEKETHEEEKAKLERDIADIEAGLQEEEERQKKLAPKPDDAGKKEEREVKDTMETRTKFFGMGAQERDAFFAREDVKTFIERVRGMRGETRAVSGAELLIPDVLLGLIREEAARASKLLRFVTERTVRGTSRQNVAGAIPEAVWTEMCASLNELQLSFANIEADGYKVGGFIPICNSTLEDSDINLASEIVTAIGGAIAKAIDKAILFGKGTKMPLGITTRLAQTEQPADWGETAPAWHDLHTSNVVKLNIGDKTGVEFFSSLITTLGVAKPVFSSDGLFWVMNRKTHLDIMVKALAFNAAAALTSGVNGTFPIIGGTIVEMEDDVQLADYEIIGGYGANYLWINREGASFASSEHVRFLDDQTVFKGTQRADGKPVDGRAFIVVNYGNVDPTTEKSFPEDYANAEMNVLGVTAAAGTASGDTVLTVTGTLAQSGAVLKYKAKATVAKINVGDTVGTGWADLTSGTTQVKAAAGVSIAVVELDSAGRVVSAGQVASVPKT